MAADHRSDQCVRLLDADQDPRAVPGNAYPDEIAVGERDGCGEPKESAGERQRPEQTSSLVRMPHFVTSVAKAVWETVKP